MKPRDVLLAAGILVGLVAIVKAAQVALTADFYAALAATGTALLASPAMRLLTIVAIVLWCLACIAMAWERAEERYRERLEEERLIREGEARSRRVRREIEEATSNRNDRGQSAA